MNKRNTLLAVVAAAAIAAGIWWWQQSKVAPVTPAPVAASPATPPPAKLAVAIVPPKTPIAAPMAPPVTVTASAKPGPAAVATIDPSLKAAVSDLIATLERQDMDGFVQNYLAPNLLETALSSAKSRMANASPAVQAQLEQTLQQQMPQIIQQITQQIAQDPKREQGFEKMAAALKLVQDSPEMNAAGNQATYKINPNKEPGVPPSVVMVNHDGKWALDLASMATQDQGQP